MDKYEELIAVFSETLEQSRDYHIAYMYQVGYVSVLGLYERDSTQNNSMKIDEVFHSPSQVQICVYIHLPAMLVRLCCLYLQEI